MQTDPYLFQRSFYHAVRVYSTESAIFKFVDFVLLADKHANDENLNIRFLARCIIVLAISHLQVENYHTDVRWARIVQRRLNWPEDSFRRDSIKLRYLIRLARALNLPRVSSHWHSRSQVILGDLLRESCSLNPSNLAPELQNEFCDLWNELVIAAQLPDEDLSLLSNVVLILSLIRATHVSLHHGAESESSTSPPNTTNLAPGLQSPSYSTCTIPHHHVTSTDRGTNFLSPIILEMPRQNQSTCMSAR
jgi:hypothetical protein